MYDFKVAEKIFWAVTLIMFITSLTLGFLGVEYHNETLKLISSVVLPLLMIAWGPICRRVFSKT